MQKPVEQQQSNHIPDAGEMVQQPTEQQGQGSAEQGTPEISVDDVVMAEKVQTSVQNEEDKLRPYEEKYGQNNVEVKAGKYNSIKSLVSAALNKAARTIAPKMWTDYARVSDTNAAAIKKATGLDVSGYTRGMTGNGIRHIFDGHGVGGDRLEAYKNQKEITPNDFEMLPDILDNPDVIEVGNSEGSQPQRIVSKKIVGDQYIVSKRCELAGKNWFL